MKITIAKSVLACAAAMLAIPALARDPDGRWANSPSHDWYLKAELTLAAQKRFGFKSCCAHSDVVKTRFRPLGNMDGWEYLEGHTWRRVPDDIIHWGESTPTGQPIMFAIGGRPTCFFPGDSGI